MNAFVQSTPVLSTTSSSTSSSWTCPQTHRARTSSPSSTTDSNNNNNNNTSVRRHHAIRMDVETVPDLEGPNTSKYLQFIPPDRLNKAPMITLNSFNNAEYNNISIMMPTLPRDIAEGDSVKQTAVADVDEEYVDDVPSSSKWAKYYPVDTVNQAPLISINYSKSATPEQSGILLVDAATVFPTVDLAKEILGKDVVPDPQLYPAFTKEEDNGGMRLNKAPFFTIVAPEQTGLNEDGYVSMESTNMPLDTHAAELILNTYRK